MLVACYGCSQTAATAAHAPTAVKVVCGCGWEGRARPVAQEDFDDPDKTSEVPHSEWAHHAEVELAQELPDEVDKALRTLEWHLNDLAGTSYEMSRKRRNGEPRPAQCPCDRHRRGYAQRMPIADSCSIRSGVSVAALLRWLLIQAPSLCSRSCWSSPMIRSTCFLGT